MKVATTAAYKTLSDLAFIFGLVSHLDEHYKGKAINESIKRVKKESNKFMSMIEGGLNQKQVNKVQKKILFISKYLDKKDVSVFTSTGLAVLDDLKKYMKDNRLKQCKILETRLMSLHKKVDTKFNKLDFDDYYDANVIFNAWRDY